MNIVKRFISGAVCPRCAVMDRVVMYESEGQRVRECIDCGFRDVMTTGLEADELETRVNRREKMLQDTPAQPIRFYPGSK